MGEWRYSRFAWLAAALCMSVHSYLCLLGRDDTLTRSRAVCMYALLCSGLVSLDNLILGHLLYAFFGITLATFPITIWGPDSVFSYWTEWGDAGMFFGRTLGLWMFLVTTSPWWAGMDKAVLAKVRQ